MEEGHKGIREEGRKVWKEGMSERKEQKATEARIAYRILPSSPPVYNRFPSLEKPPARRKTKQIRREEKRRERINEKK